MSPKYFTSNRILMCVLGFVFYFKKKHLLLTLSSTSTSEDFYYYYYYYSLQFFHNGVSRCVLTEV